MEILKCPIFQLPGELKMALPETKEIQISKEEAAKEDARVALS
jgi:hypothetical protein